MNRFLINCYFQKIFKEILCKTIRPLYICTFFTFVISTVIILSPAICLAQGASRALDFDGNDDYVSIPDATSLDITNAVTVEAWVKPASGSAGIKSEVSIYNFVGKIAGSGNHIARDFHVDVYDPSDPPPNYGSPVEGQELNTLTDTGISSGTPQIRTLINEYASDIEATQTQYNAIEASDDNRWRGSGSGPGNNAVLWFQFDIAEDPATISNIECKYEGYQSRSKDKGWFAIWNYYYDLWHVLEASRQTSDYEYFGTINMNPDHFIENGKLTLIFFNEDVLKGVICDYIEVRIYPGQEEAVGIRKKNAYGIGASDTAYASINRNTIKTPIDTTVWNHLALTYDKDSGGTDEMKLYINGVQSATYDYSTAISTNDNDLIIGDILGFKGQIDEVRIWDTALDQTTIRDYMFKKVTNSHPNYSNLKGYWKFDETSGTNCPDSSGNGNNGTMTNMDPATDRVWSTCPIGDDFIYTTTALNLNLASSDGDDITIQNITGSPDLIALICIEENPNYTGVVELDYVYTFRYWEVWMTGGTSPQYDIVYNYDGYPGIVDEDSLRLGYRTDASVSQWSNAWRFPNTTENTITDINISENRQFILASHSYVPECRNYYVRKSGNDNNDGLTPETAWEKVSKAAGSPLTPCDTVFIGAGTYGEDVTISHSGTLHSPIVYYGDQSGLYTGDPGTVTIGRLKKGCIIDNQSNLVLIGITFQSVKDYGIYMSNAENITIRGCTASDANWGIFSTGGKGFIKIVSDTINSGGNDIGIEFISSDPGLMVTINNNYITSVATGIYLSETNADSISFNTINTIINYGISLVDVDECNTISYNNIDNMETWGMDGIYLNNSSCSEISNNNIYSVNRYGICCDLSRASDLIGSIEYNIIHDVNTQSGIYVNQINCNSISKNDIYNITTNHGILYNGNSNYTVSSVDSNTIHDCSGSGIQIDYPLDVNSISRNTIYNNTSGIYLNYNTAYKVDSLSHNRIFSIQNGGVYIAKIKNSKISNNLIYGNLNTDSYGIRINDNDNESVNIVNNTIYDAGQYGIYGSNTAGIWKNNIISTHNTWGIRGDGIFNVIDSYNCVYNSTDNWSEDAFPGTGSFSEDPLFVDPDGTDNILGGSGWQDDDLHIQSTVGSWHFGAWTPDNENSPCIDKGSPADAYGNEPTPHGSRINIGAYGNTSQASLSHFITAVFPNFPDSAWILMGTPVEPLDGDPLAVYGDDFGVTVPDYTKWLVLRWNTEWAEYFEYGDTLWPPPDCSPGISHFIYQITGTDVSVDVEGYPISRNKEDTLIVEPVSDKYEPPAPGWNMFANPYNFTIDWSDAYILEGEGAGETQYSLLEAATDTMISQVAYIWDSANEQYENIYPTEANNSDSLSVWQGFWFIQLDSISQLKLVMYPSTVLGKPAPMAKALNSMGMKYRYRTSAVSNHWDWFLKLGVVSENYKMQDVGNGIGESSLADDAYDAWDAFEFRGQDIRGNFAQLEFIHDDRRSFSYDIHAQFTNTSTWKFRVSTNSKNANKNFVLVWPQIRLVPETVGFSLFDSDPDNSTPLISDLRGESSYTFGFDQPDSIKIFYIRAIKVPDSNIPVFSFVISQNVFIPNDMTVYIIPSEPLATISASKNDEPVDLSKISSPPYVYYAREYLAGGGTLTLEVKGTDHSGNTGSGSTTIQYQLMKANDENKLTDKESGVELYLPKGILPNDVALVLNRSKMNLTIPPNMIPKGDPVYIGPEPLDFKGHALLAISELPNSSSAGLYRHSNSKWEYISPCSKKMKISETGIYQIFCKSNDPDGAKILPGRFILHKCYPNPFNSSTMIRYDLQNEGEISLVIYDVLGREVRELVSKRQNPGFYNVIWNGKNNYGSLAASGIYFIHLKVTDDKNILFKNSKKITLIK